MRNKVVDEENDCLNLEASEHALINDLSMAPPFRFARILRRHYAAANDKMTFLDRVDQIFNFYYRVQGSRDYINPFSFRGNELLTMMEELDKLIDECSTKPGKRKRERRPPPRMTLRDLFKDRTEEFKSDFRAVVLERRHRTKTKTFHDVVHFFWSEASEFPTSVSMISEMFLKEFGKELGTKSDALRRGLKYKDKGTYDVPSTIRETFHKYTSSLR